MLYVKLICVFCRGHFWKTFSYNKSNTIWNRLRFFDTYTIPQRLTYSRLSRAFPCHFYLTFNFADNVFYRNIIIRSFELFFEKFNSRTAAFDWWPSLPWRVRNAFVPCPIRVVFCDICHILCVH